MTVHRLKTWPVHFGPVKEDRKRAELRKDDRDFKVGDILVLEEYDPDLLVYTCDKGDPDGTCHRLVTHALRGGLVPEGYVLLSIAPMDWAFGKRVKE